jgi:hypothetical protein
MRITPEKRQTIHTCTQKPEWFLGKREEEDNSL